MNEAYRDYLESKHQAQTARDILITEIQKVIEGGPRQGMTLQEIMYKMNIPPTPSNRSSIISLIFNNNLCDQYRRTIVKSYVMLDENNKPIMDTVYKEQERTTFYRPYETT